MWRLRWLLHELFDRSTAPALRAELEIPAFYKLSLLLKVLHWMPGSIVYRLRRGGVLKVRNFMTAFIFREIFLDGCYDMTLGNPRPVIIDVGANTGLFAVRAKQLWPDATIHCYEPFPKNVQELEATLAANRFTDVTVFPEGVGGDSREASLNVHRSNIGGHSIIAAPGNQKIMIRLVGLREVLARTGARSCDLLKLDCEGAEHEIIMSIDDELADRIGNIVYEYSAGATAPEARRHLEGLGYKVMRRNALFFAQR